MSAAPKRIKAAGTTFRVEYHEKIMSAEPDSIELSGDCQFSQQRIRISLAQGEDKQKSTLLHETVHAIADELNYNWDEDTVLQAERIVWLLIRDNPGLVKYVKERTKEKE